MSVCLFLSFLFHQPHPLFAIYILSSVLYSFVHLSPNSSSVLLFNHASILPSTHTSLSIDFLPSFNVFPQSSFHHFPSSFLIDHPALIQTFPPSFLQCSNCRGVGGLNPLPHLADPPTSGQNSTPGVEF